MFDDGWDLQWFLDRAKGRENTFRHIAQICEQSRCKTVLDVGGGVGVLRRFLPMDIKHDVVDLSPNAKLYGESLFPDVRFTTGQIDDVDRTYDAIVGIQLVEHMREYESFLRSAWNKAGKIVVITFRNGLDETEKIKLHKGCGDYWDNKYSLPGLENWINKELQSVIVNLSKVKVDRDYSPEIVLAFHKESA